MYHFCEYMKHFFKMLHILHSENIRTNTLQETVALRLSVYIHKPKPLQQARVPHEHSFP